MRVNKALVLGAIGVVLVAGGAFAVVKLRAPKPPQYLTATAKQADIEDAVLATGSLQPFDVVNVGSQVSGMVVSIKVKLGNKVKKGDLMALIESQQLDNQLRNTQSQLVNQQGFLASQQANLSMNQAAVERYQKLLDMKVGTPVDLERSKAQLAQTQAQINQANAQVRQRQIEIEQAQANLERANIRAPMDAMVAEVVAHEGTTVNASQTTPVIVRLAKMDTMTVRAQVSEADIIKVRAGQKVYFTVLGDPGKRYYATLRTVEITPASGTLDPTAGGTRQQQAVYYNALFEVPNANGILLPAMTAEVHVVQGEAHNVLAIPSVALGDKVADHIYKVRVLAADGKAEARQITTGLDNRSNVEVKSGLKAGDKVIIGEAGGPSAAAPSQPLLSRPSVPQ